MFVTRPAHARSPGWIGRCCARDSQGEPCLTCCVEIGIALGSLVIAELAVWLVAGMVLGRAASGNPLVGLAALVLGALIYLDIMHREGRVRPD